MMFHNLRHILGNVANRIMTLLFLILLVECVSPDQEGSSMPCRHMPDGGPSLPKSGFQRKDPRNFSQGIFMKTPTFSLITKVVSTFLFEMGQSFLIMFMIQMDVSRLPQTSFTCWKNFFLIKCEVITFNLLTFFWRLIFKLIKTDRVFLVQGGDKFKIQI